MDAGILAIIMVFSIPLVAVIGGLVIAALRIIKGSGSERTRVQNADETRMIQDMYQGFRKMEQRVEALETILLERERKGTSV